MRIVCRVAERLVDPRLELLGDDVLQTIGLGMHVIDVDTERLGEVELEQAARHAGSPAAMPSHVASVVRPCASAWDIARTPTTHSCTGP